MPLTIETREEFAERHGNAYVVIDDGDPKKHIGYMPKAQLFANGATCPIPDDPDGRREPPSDEKERLELQLQFASKVLERTERGFNEYKTAIEQSIEMGYPANELHPNVTVMPKWIEPHWGPQPDDAILAIKQLRSLVLQWRARTQKIDDRLYEMEKGETRAETDAQARRDELASQQRQADELAKIEGIDI